MSSVTKEESEKILKDMATDEFKLDFSTLLKVRYPLIYIRLQEERRFIDFLEHFCRVNAYECKIWDAYNGLIDLETREKDSAITDDISIDPIAILDHIISQGKVYVNKKESVQQKRSQGIKGIVFVLLDYHRFIEETPDIERRIKVIAGLNSIVSTIITGCSYKSTDAIDYLMPCITFPFANSEEIKNALYQVVNSVEKKLPNIRKHTKEVEETLINSVRGLTLMEAQTAFSKSLVSKRGWDIPTILKEKKQVISKSGMLEFYDRTVSMSDVGGLKNLVHWIEARRSNFSKEAEKYGLEKPRGLLTIGMPGCVCEETKIRVKKISKEGKIKIYRPVSENLPACRGG
jgi:hypothetical protein